MFIVSFVLINDIKKTEWSFFRVAVRIAGGFIRNNHLWIMGRRMGNAHTLLSTLRFAVSSSIRKKRKAQGDQRNLRAGWLIQFHVNFRQRLRAAAGVGYDTAVLRGPLLIVRYGLDALKITVKKADPSVFT